MPHIDKRSGDIVIRIVYDGAPEAGKTTNIVKLLASIPMQRRGAQASPGTTGMRTEFFDWLDFAGGFVDGRRLRCQLVSVPGQPHLLHRRKYLLETADAVVFVADSHPTHVAKNRVDLATLRRIFDRMGSRSPAGLVLQANKQDVPGALSAADLATAIVAPSDMPALPTVAVSGRGVMETFVLATRLATDRVRKLVLEGDLAALGDSDVSPAALHSAMVELEAPAAIPSAPEPPAPKVERVRRPSPIHRRPNAVDKARASRVPRAESLLAGHVWPSVRGRSTIALATEGRAVAVPERARDWAPSDPIEVALGDGWLVHSSGRWLFQSESDARIALVTTVRGCLVQPDLVPEWRALFVGPDEGGFRMWMLSRAIPTVADEALLALDALDSQALASALDRARRATELLRDSGHPGLVAGGAAAVAIHQERVVVLAAHGAADHAELGAPDEHVQRLATEYAADDDARSACLATAVGRPRQKG